MRKNFTLLFLIGIFGLFASNLFAQEDATIAPADIRYWIGQGENEVIFIANWNNPDTALAWGYRFNEETLIVKEVMDGIAATDPRFSYQAGGWGVTDLLFNDGFLNLSLYGNFWMYNVNGITAGLGYDAQPVGNGDVIKFGDESVGIITDYNAFTYVWEKEVVGVYALASEAKIEASDIRYWIGEGANEVVFAVNWADPNVCYAWGFRFDGSDVTVKDMMDAIATADNRFNYRGEGGMVYDITYDTDNEHLALVGDYWMYNINGAMAMLSFSEQTIQNGDFVKFGDINCASEIAQWTYVWECPVLPVVDNTGVNENQLAARLYPNPATSHALLDVQIQDQATVTVADIQGRVVRSFVMTQNDEPVRIETSDFEAGVYFVTVSDAARHQTLKLVVR